MPTLNIGNRPLGSSSDRTAACRRANVDPSQVEIGVVVLSQHSDELHAHELLKDGTAGLAYLLKERVSELDALVRTLKEVVAGGR